MHLPEGKGGVVIDSSLMLKEAEPIIGTGELGDITDKAELDMVQDVLMQIDEESRK